MSRHILNIRYLFLILTAALLCLSSCRDRKDIIPKGTMSKIYYDIYMTDEAVDVNYGLRKMADTMRIYEPIFNKYGYTTEDYNRSVSFYLERPDKFESVFEDTKTMLEKRKAELNAILEAEGKRPRLWSLVDSLELYTSEGVHAGMAYKCMRILFFKPDSTIPESPVIDSAFMERPVNRFLIFNDSALNADKNFTFYSTPGFMNEVDRLLEIQDSIQLIKDSIQRAERAAGLENTVDRNDTRPPVFKDVMDDKRNFIRQRKELSPLTSSIRNNRQTKNSEKNKKEEDK